MKENRGIGAILTLLAAVLAAIAIVLYGGVMYKYQPVYFMLGGAAILGALGFAAAKALPSASCFMPVVMTALLLEAWYPLGHGDASLLSNPTIKVLADKYGKNAGQIILRFEVQDGVITLPKSTNPERMRTNLDILDFELTGDEMNKIRAMDTGKGSHDPDAPGVEQMLRSAFVIED